jgi:alkanesulfonate monooxygenase SsuD/methylene tetrahydromethanopterin reductase-like flavin-dependent oxidoreductase (luciferase family)
MVCKYGASAGGRVCREDAMKFGIFFELTVPAPYTSELEQQVYRDAIAQGVLADQLGFEYLWAVEHHFLRGYSHCPAPELFLTALAMVTSRIRLGHGAVVCIPEMNHPIRVAERVATLDILSAGRVEVGTARSSTWTELAGFGVNPDTTKKSWDEFVHVLPKMWMQEYFSHDGYSFSMPERTIVPKPVQQPHPPLWVAVSTKGTDIDAAERGMGCLGIAVTGFARQEAATREYRRRIRSCNPVGGVVNENVATLNWLYCDEDAGRAAEIGLPMVRNFLEVNAQLLWTREAFPTPAYQYRDRPNLSPPEQRAGSSPGARATIPQGLAIGDPERLVRELKQWESVGVDAVNFIINSSELIPQEKVLDSLHLFAREVMPHFVEQPAATSSAPVAVAGGSA